MNLKPIVRLQLRYDYRVFRIMYLVVYCIIALNAVYELLIDGQRGNAHTSGLELATMITIFIVGLHSFKEFFLFYSANGVSRRRVFAGITVSLAIAAACTALIDTINTVIFSLFLNYTPLYSVGLHTHDIADFSAETAGFPAKAALTAPLLARILLWCFCAYLACALFGLCLSMLYYRMNRALKVVFSAGIPVFLLVVLPALDRNITGGRVTSALAAAVRWWFNCSTVPSLDLATHFALAALLAGASFLLIRRAEIRQS